MENKDTNTDYQNVVRVGDQKWEIVETTFRINFLFEIRIHYILYRVLKSHPPICMFWKMAQEPPTDPPHHTEGGGANYDCTNGSRQQSVISDLLKQ